MMKNKQIDYSKHFELAKKETVNLGYKNLLDLSIRGTAEHKNMISAIYKQEQVNKDI